ncbi:hypothetical protein GCM10010400_49510 [Streptomyces aculeolatus]
MSPSLAMPRATKKRPNSRLRKGRRGGSGSTGGPPCGVPGAPGGGERRAGVGGQGDEGAEEEVIGLQCHPAARATPLDLRAASACGARTSWDRTVTIARSQFPCGWGYLERKGAV